MPDDPDLFDPEKAVWDIRGTADATQKVEYTVDPDDPWKVSFTMPSYNVTVDAAFGLDYVKTTCNGTEVVTTDELILGAINLASVTDQEGVTIGDGNWYYTKGSDADFENRITIRGEANLILCDGATFRADLGIHLNNHGHLIIWGQSEGTGSLEIKMDKTNEVAGIGGGYDDGLISGDGGDGGVVDIYGGDIQVKMQIEGRTDESQPDTTTWYANSGAAIGGSRFGNGGTLNMYGGTLYAQGGESALQLRLLCHEGGTGREKASRNAGHVYQRYDPDHLA